MKKYAVKTILVPTDFSTTSENAVSFAVELAKKCRARIVLVNVVEIPIMTSPDGNYVDAGYVIGDLLKTSKSSLRETATRITHEHKIETEYCAMQGFLYENVIRSVHLTHADIIVMGTGGADGISETLFGSNAFRIVNHSPVPVITINEELKLHDVTQIIFPVNEEALTLQKANEVSYLAKIYAAEVLLLGIITDSPNAEPVNNNLVKLNSLFSERNIKSNIKVVEGYNYADEILKICNNNKSVIVAVAAKQEHGILSLFHSKPDENLVNHALVPVLSVPV